jgi:DNA-binding transcriptional ArsR family regulator
MSAVRVFGGPPARLAVLAQLAAHPHSTVGEIASDIGVSRSTVKNHIFALVNEGAVDADERRWPQTRYSLRTDVIEAHYRQLGQLLGVVAS